MQNLYLVSNEMSGKLIKLVMLDMVKTQNQNSTASDLL